MWRKDCAQRHKRKRKKGEKRKKSKSWWALGSPWGSGAWDAMPLPLPPSFLGPIFLGGVGWGWFRSLRWRQPFPLSLPRPASCVQKWRRGTGERASGPSLPALVPLPLKPREGSSRHKAELEGQGWASVDTHDGSSGFPAADGTGEEPLAHPSTQLSPVAFPACHP